MHEQEMDGVSKVLGTTTTHIYISELDMITTITIKICRYNASYKYSGSWEHTVDFAPSIAKEIASNAARPSMNHWTWLPSSVKPRGGAKEPKRWGLHQPSGGRRPTSLIAATQSLTFALLFVLSFMFRLPQVTYSISPLSSLKWSFQARKEYCKQCHSSINNIFEIRLFIVINKRVPSWHF